MLVNGLVGGPEFEPGASRSRTVSPACHGPLPWTSRIVTGYQSRQARPQQSVRGESPGHRLNAIAHSQLGEDLLDVLVDCVCGDTEARRDLAVREPSHKVCQSLVFSSG
jgi:hypothetical protein